MNSASPARLPFDKVRLGQRGHLYRSGRYLVAHLSVVFAASSDSADSRGSVPAVSSVAESRVIVEEAACFHFSVQVCITEAALGSTACGHRIGSLPCCEGLEGSGSHTFRRRGQDRPGSSSVSCRLE